MLFLVVSELDLLVLGLVPGNGCCIGICGCWYFSRKFCGLVLKFYI